MRRRRGPRPADQARIAIEQANATRLATGRTPGSPELADPVGQSEAVYARTADEIDALVTQLVVALFR